MSGRAKLSPLGKAITAVDEMIMVLPPHLAGLKRDLSEVLGWLQATALGLDGGNKKPTTKKRKKKGTK